MKSRKYGAGVLITLALLCPVSSVLGQTGLLSDPVPFAENASLISAAPEDAGGGERGILSASVVNETEEETGSHGLLSFSDDTPPSAGDDYMFDFDTNNEMWNTESFDISLSGPVSGLEEFQPMNYAYRPGMGEAYMKLNSDAASIINRYMEKADYIPVRDPLWFLAIGALEYNYSENDSDIIFSWPVDTFAARMEPDYLLKYNWREVQRIGGDGLVTRRTGGAIGPFQLESFYGAGTEPLIPEDFGIIGAADGQPRTDCWVELGAAPNGGGDIIWKQGTYADRWSVADAANQSLAVYNETIRQSGFTELDRLPDRYGKAALLMWAHNRGTNILGQESARESVEKILAFKDELELLIMERRPARFARQDYFMDKVNEISEYAGCADYPVMSLISYMIVEKRYAGLW